MWQVVNFDLLLRHPVHTTPQETLPPLGPCLPTIAKRCPFSDDARTDVYSYKLSSVEAPDLRWGRLILFSVVRTFYKLLHPIDYGA